MRFMHISDLHLGLKLYDYPMIEEQRFILDQIAEIAVTESCDAVIIAGDIYDRSVPPEEAVLLFDSFISALHKNEIAVLAISGNHDSADRLSFAGSILSERRVYIASVYRKNEEPVILNDEYGLIKIWLLPFVKPVNVRSELSDDEIHSFNDALKAAVENMDIDTAQRNIIVTHQYVTGARRSDSEQVSTTVGGLDNVDASVFDGFDYVALGHLHTPQIIAGNECFRYCGTPLKYSFSESDDDKSVSIVDIKEKDNVSVKTVILKPLHDMIMLKDTYNTLASKAFKDSVDTDSFVHVTLTDREAIPDAAYKLRTMYPRLLNLEYEHLHSSVIEHMGVECAQRAASSPLELFEEIFEKQYDQKLSDKQRDYLDKMINDVWGENR